MSIEIDGVPVHHVDSYVYLGNQLDSKLNLNDNFDKAYKKATGRLNLLTNLRSFLNFEAAYKIFEMVIAPIVLYSLLIHLQLTSTIIFNNFPLEIRESEDAADFRKRLAAHF